jgi:hypothetical protein
VNGSLADGIFAANEVDDRGPPAVGRPTDPGGLVRSRADVGCERGALCHVRTIAESLFNDVPETAANLSKDTGSRSISLSIMTWLSRFGRELQAVWESF